MMRPQTQVPPALQELLALGAKTSAPGPMGQPIPTVAAQKAVQATQQDAAEMAGIAGPLIAQNQQQAMMDQIAQMAASKVAQSEGQDQGIAALPQAQPFKSGGEVKKFNSGREVNGMILPEAVTPERFIAGDRIAGLPKRTLGVPTFEIGQGADSIPQLRKWREQIKSPVEKAAIDRMIRTIEAASGTRSVAQPAASNAPVDPTAGLMGIFAAPQVDLSDIEKVAKRGEYKAAAPTPEAYRERRQAERTAMGLKGMPGAGLEALAAQMTAQNAALAESRSKGQKDLALENFIASLSGARTGGLSEVGKIYAKRKAQQRTDEEKFRETQYNREFAIKKLNAAAEDVREAAASGNAAAYEAALDKHARAKDQYDESTIRAQIELTKIRSGLAESQANRAKEALFLRALAGDPAIKGVKKELLTAAPEVRADAAAAAAAARRQPTEKDKARIRASVIKDADTFLKTHVPYVSLSNNPAAQAEMREQEIQKRMNEVFQKEGFTTEGAGQRIVNFSDIPVPKGK